MTLFQLDVPLEAEVDIPAKDIGWVKLKDTARLKFDAFPFQQCGTLEGTIVYISQDAFTKGVTSQEQTGGTDDGGEPTPASKGTTYLARMKISGSLKGRAAKVKLLPGMRIKAEIKVGKRTVINYLLNPFVKALDESVREP